MTVRDTIRASLVLLDRRDRRLLGLSMLLQMATSLLDLIGVSLIGLAGSLSMSAVQGQPPPKAVMGVVSALGLEGLSDRALLGVLAGSAAALLLAKSVVSPLLMARVFRFLARRQALVSARLAKALLSRPLTFVQQRSSQVTAAALLQGANSATVIVLGQTVVAASEIALLTVLALALLLVNPLVALFVIAFFALIGAGLQKVLGHRAARLSTQGYEAEVASLSVVQEALGAYREISVADRRAFYVERIQGLRVEAARVSAGLQVFGMLSKYVSESALVLGAFSLAAVLFTTQPVAAAAGTFALFLATATRVMPSLLRLQNAALTIRTASGTAAPTFALAEDLDHPLDAPGASGNRDTIRQVIRRGHPDFVPCIELHSVSFSYPEADAPAIRQISLRIPQGGSAALIGRSGAGKSTLADVILGVLQPDLGSVAVGGVPPADAVQRWPGGIAYVPQDVILANDSIRGNVALGLPRDAVDDDLVWDALRRAHLADYVRSGPDGLDAPVGERGLRLSGGQRQRLGIARALFTRPRLLVLDEATSALDAETEQVITAMIDELENHVTTVIIAHRLSTIRNVDVVVYLEKGQTLAQGTFDEVCARVPALQRQATLMGLQAESG